MGFMEILVIVISNHAKNLPHSYIIGVQDKQPGASAHGRREEFAVAEEESRVFLTQTSQEETNFAKSKCDRHQE